MRVVVTGHGVLTPVGIGWAETWSGLTEGRSGIGTLTGVDVSGLPVTIGGQLSGLDFRDYLPHSLAGRAGGAARLALVAAELALEDAGMTAGDLDPPRTGVVIGSVGAPTEAVLGAAAALDARGFKGVNPYTFATTGIVTPAGEVALRIGAQGPCLALATACATGANCVGEALRLIQHGRADVVLAGGADDTLNRLDIAAAARSGALSRRNDDPEAASRPFDRDRDGFVMSAGAAVLVLESAEHALARGARIYGEIAGYGATTDGHHVTAPHPEGVAVERAVRQALADAGVAPGEVGYVNAHGTSTPLNDAAELKVIRRVFEDRSLPVSSTKSMTGHMLAAAGAVEAAVALESVRTGIAPPTINCDNPDDPELNLVPHKSQEHSANVAISNSFGFGGHNAVLVVRRWRPDVPPARHIHWLFGR
ncbi:beta-ketoacyl-[acyl-carrier-protein] synthase family protein [Nonomuraea sp. 10N515B]|uniref:beta-ketoacyl-[acyl-carrier-protein] synthase family protein n=1 Tax=Nonomuraea sp. 10N515B TaxID=3457422 RepID=UPI003FCDFA8D